MKKRVALLQGGLGAEREVSRVTGAAFAKALEQLGYDYTVVEAGADLPADLMRLKPDVALLALHGKYAEDGTVQGICEYLKIPYSGSGIFASALCLDKTYTKQILLQNKIPAPTFELVDTRRVEISQAKNPFGFPVVVKPSREGSSVGVTIVKKQEEWTPALQEAARYDHYVMVEQFISGKEVTVSVLEGRALTSIEIEPKTEFYNYKNKYTAGNTNYYLPARIRPESEERLRQIAERTFDILRLRTYGRVDMMLDQKENPYVIEVNTLPGCTPTSLFPKAVQHSGIEFKELIRILVESARLDYEGLS